jgi:hypothetical protein
MILKRKINNKLIIVSILIIFIKNNLLKVKVVSNIRHHIHNL